MSLGQTDPYFSSNPSPLPSLTGGSNSLAQAARMKSLNQARYTLIAIGILTIAANLFFGLAADDAVKREFDKELAAKGLNRAVVDQVKLQEAEEAALRITRLASFGFAALGAIFVAAGALIKKYPVPISIVSLVLYLGSTVIMGMLDTDLLLKGIIIKVIIIVALVKAVQAAIAYQKALDEEAHSGFAGSNG